ncbi:hypothetical protein BS50DRAFT_160197 [Corynespora cassiicola Philippines]|uniref:Uncharacterized protein n=1 Tax=Corynespora cassiicola Philippines TaxID=1448308 RepID=A0A2T2N660_CORCC|nr:hypothetical protein BS50DRAFT_160197 [Corynespora cassiicola Philippines]
MYHWPPMAWPIGNTKTCLLQYPSTSVSSAFLHLVSCTCLSLFFFCGGSLSHPTAYLPACLPACSFLCVLASIDRLFFLLSSCLFLVVLGWSLLLCPACMKSVPVSSAGVACTCISASAIPSHPIPSYPILSYPFFGQSFLFVFIFFLLSLPFLPGFPSFSYRCTPLALVP